MGAWQLLLARSGIAERPTYSCISTQPINQREYRRDERPIHAPWSWTHDRLRYIAQINPIDLEDRRAPASPEEGARGVEYYLRLRRAPAGRLTEGETGE